MTYQKDNKLLQYQLDSLKRHSVSSHDAESFQDEIDRLRKDCQRSETDNKILRERIQELSSENEKLKIKAANIDDERKQYQEERRKWEQQNTIILLEKAKLERSYRSYKVNIYQLLQKRAHPSLRVVLREYVGVMYLSFKVLEMKMVDGVVTQLLVVM